MNEIWNEVVREGIAFPQLELLDEHTGAEFFAAQTCCAGGREHRRDPRAVHPPPQQRRPLRPYRQRQLCRRQRAARAAHWRSAGAQLPCPGPGSGIPHPAVQRRGEKQRRRPASLQKAGLCQAGRHSRRVPKSPRRLRGHYFILPHIIKSKRCGIDAHSACFFIKIDPITAADRTYPSSSPGRPHGTAQ